MTCKDCLKKELGYCKFDCAEPQRCDDFKHKSEMKNNKESLRKEMENGKAAD